jgi:hypothetical protein
MVSQMSYTAEDRDQLKAAIAKGATKMRLGNEEVTFRSLKEMRETLALIETELAVSPTPRRHYPVMTRGT